MAGPCSAEFEQMAARLGGIDCAAAHPVLTVRNPAGLENWTLPVVEALMVAGAVLALAHAWRTWRRRGDPTGLAVWLAATAYVLVLEPPLYFPAAFGLDESVGLVFVHNVFTVEFLYDRMPLYIVALYPSGIYLTYVLVERIGAFARHGALVGAATVGFVHHCFYEVFDALGPQLRWWAWNPAVATNEPAAGSVPLSSAFVFATVGPFGVTLLVRLLVSRRAARSDGLGLGGVVGWAVLAGLLTPLVLPLAGLPAGLAGLGRTDAHTLQAVVLGAGILAFGVVAVVGLVGGPPPGEAGAPPADRFLAWYPVAYGVAYLATFGVLWATALPAYLDAEGGVTHDGTPVGNLAYVVACVAVCVWVLALATRATRATRQPAPAAAPDPGEVGLNAG